MPTYVTLSRGKRSAGMCRSMKRGLLKAWDIIVMCDGEGKG